MGKDTNPGAESNKADERRLWEINEVTINENYTKETELETGQIYYKRKNPNATTLPGIFYELDWISALEEREAAEKLVSTSARAALDARRRTDGKLLSQEIANNPNMVFIRSSAEEAKRRRADDTKG